MPLFKVCASVHAQRVRLCVCVCAPVLACTGTSSPFQELVALEASHAFFLSCSQPQSLRAQPPSFTGQARQAELGGGEGEDPHCCPSVLRWDEACGLHPVAGWVEVEGSQEEVPMAGKS